MNDAFYIGYLPKAPAGLSKWIARIAVALVLGGLGIAAILVIDQPPFSDSRFEFGVYREYHGIVDYWPYPMLRTGAASFLLVAPGKHGLTGVIAPIEGSSIRLQGALIERGRDRMLEVLPASVHEAAPLAIGPLSKAVPLGSVKLRGEIVDSKCYLGVMNPGEGKVHRDCAARCISGGIPPAMIARDASGDARLLLLVGANGRALNREVLPFVAEPVEISGTLVGYGSSLILKAEPSSFRRNPE
jgi:hypothetical protein